MTKLMHRGLTAGLLLACLPAFVACTPKTSGETGAEAAGGSSKGTGGARSGGDGGGNGGTGGGSGGTAATGGSSASGGSGVGGMTGGAGGSGSGGAGAGGSGGGQGGAGAGGNGSAEGGAGGNGGSGDGGSGETGGGPAPSTGSKPSEGCGKANPPTGTRMFTSGGRATPFIVSLPPNYDPMKPLPMGFALHGFGRNHEDCRRSDCPNVQSVMGPHAILIFLKSFGAGWETDTRAQNLQLFGDILPALKKEYCVDESRVFVAGTSSGAAFTNILGCKFGDQLRLVSPVAGPADNTGCKGTPAALVMHGISDGVARGENARNLYAQRNGCTMTTTPPLAEVRAKISAARTARRGEIGCASYEGCMKAPVRWCEHSFGGYDNSTHGWPPPGSELIWEMVKSLP